MKSEPLLKVGDIIDCHHGTVYKCIAVEKVTYELELIEFHNKEEIGKKYKGNRSGTTLVAPSRGGKIEHKVRPSGNEQKAYILKATIQPRPISKSVLSV